MRWLMRTNVILDDHLMQAARHAGGYKTKKAAIEAGLKMVVQLAGQKKIRALRGKITWEGDLHRMRSSK